MLINEITEMAAFAQRGTDFKKGSKNFYRYRGDGEGPFGSEIAIGKFDGTFGPGMAEIHSYPPVDRDTEFGQTKKGDAAYKTHKDMLIALDNLSKLSNGKYDKDTVNWINSPDDDKLRAFVVTPVITVEPADAADKIHYIGKFVVDAYGPKFGYTRPTKAKPGGAWIGQKKSHKATAADFDTNELAKFGYYNARGNSEKPGDASDASGEETLNVSELFSINRLDPNNFPGLAGTPHTPDEVLKILQSRLRDNPLYEFANSIKSGNKPFELRVTIPEGVPVKELKERFNLIGTAFSEITQPLAYCSSNVDGDTTGVKNRKSAKILFPSKRTEAGYDSLVSVGKEEIKISSKLMGGNPAYIGGFKESLANRPELAKKYPDAYNDLLQLVSANPTPGKNNEDGILKLALDNKLLTQADVNYLKKMYSSAHETDITKFSDMPPTLRSFLPTKGGKFNNAHPQSGLPQSIYYTLNKTISSALSSKLNYKNGTFNNELSKLMGELMADRKIITISTVPSFQVDGNELVYSVSFHQKNIGDPASGGSAVALLSGHGATYGESRAPISYSVLPAGKLPTSPTGVTRPTTQTPTSATDNEVNNVSTVNPSPTEPVAAVGNKVTSGAKSTQIQQKTIQALKTPGSPLNKALLAIKDPTERAEAEEEALGNINAGQDSKAVLARLQSWLAESNELLRIKDLIKY